MVALGAGRFRVRYRILGEPLVSVVIPTRDRLELLRIAVASVLERSGWRNLELVVIDNGSSDPETLRFLERVASPHRVLRRPGPFDWAGLNNDAAREARGEYLFLNNDVEAREYGWIEPLLEHAQRPGVGPVGAKLLYPDGTIEHAGVALGMDGFAGHPFRGALADDPGPCGVLSVARECSAVTGACLMIRHGLFQSLGGSIRRAPNRLQRRRLMPAGPRARAQDDLGRRMRGWFTTNRPAAAPCIPWRVPPVVGVGDARVERDPPLPEPGSGTPRHAPSGLSARGRPGQPEARSGGVPASAARDSSNSSPRRRARGSHIYR